MPLTEIKKAKPVSMKSSGTDDPSKYVGGWESYDKPQGINARRDRKVLAKEDATLLPLNDDTIRQARQFLVKKWNERFQERTGQQRTSSDMSGSCKFVSMFVQKVFGGEIQGNYDHQFNIIHGKLVDLNHDAADVKYLENPHHHDPKFWRNPDHRASMRSCEPRVAQWAQEFIAGQQMAETIQEDAETDPNLWNGKSSVWTNGQYHIVVDTPGNAKYISVWTQDNIRIGYLETRTIPGYKDWLAIGDVGLLKDHRGKRLGIQMYRVLIQEMAPKYKGIAGYLPDTINKREVPAIYRRLGGKPDPENADVILVPRGNLVEADAYGPNGMTRFAPEAEVPALDVGQAEQDAIKKSKRPAMSVVRAAARALSARGKPPRLNPYKLDETIRTPVLGSLTAAYEIVDDNEAVVGAAEVQSGVIQRLDIDTTADEAYRGQIISALLDQIVSGADRQMANLSIQINSIDREVKSLLERFGFRLAGGSVMKRNHGSIRPPSVPATPGLSNR